MTKLNFYSSLPTNPSHGMQPTFQKKIVKKSCIVVESDQLSWFSSVQRHQLDVFGSGDLKSAKNMLGVILPSSNCLKRQTELVLLLKEWEGTVTFSPRILTLVFFKFSIQSCMCFPTRIHFSPLMETNPPRCPLQPAICPIGPLAGSQR